MNTAPCDIPDPLVINDALEALTTCKRLLAWGTNSAAIPAWTEVHALHDALFHLTTEPTPQLGPVRDAKDDALDALWDALHELPAPARPGMAQDLSLEAQCMDCVVERARALFDHVLALRELL